MIEYAYETPIALTCYWYWQTSQ